MRRKKTSCHDKGVLGGVEEGGTRGWEERGMTGEEKTHADMTGCAERAIEKATASGTGMVGAQVAGGLSCFTPDMPRNVAKFGFTWYYFIHFLFFFSLLFLFLCIFVFPCPCTPRTRVHLGESMFCEIYLFPPFLFSLSSPLLSPSIFLFYSSGKYFLLKL